MTRIALAEGVNRFNLEIRKEIDGEQTIFTASMGGHYQKTNVFGGGWSDRQIVVRLFEQLLEIKERDKMERVD